MRTPTWLFALVIGTSTTATLGCDILEKFAKKAQEAAEKAEKEKEENQDPDYELGMKLNNHIECLNHVSGSVLRASGRYYSWIEDPEKGPQNEKVVYGLYKISEAQVDQCKAALKKGKEEPPEDEKLDDVSEDYEKALDEVVELADEAYTYYNEKQGYKNDGFKEGKKLHKKLTKAFDDFEKAHEKLNDMVGELKDGMAERELARVEKEEGKNLYWHSRKLNLSARQVVETGHVDMEDLDVVGLKSVVKEFESDLEAMKKQAKSAKDEQPVLYSSYESDGFALLRSANALIKRKEENRDFSQSEIMMINGANPQMVEGHPAELQDKFNTFINRSNSLTWR